MLAKEIYRDKTIWQQQFISITYPPLKHCVIITIRLSKLSTATHRMRVYLCLQLVVWNNIGIWLDIAGHTFLNTHHSTALADGYSRINWMSGQIEYRGDNDPYHTYLISWFARLTRRT